MRLHLLAFAAVALLMLAVLLMAPPADAASRTSSALGKHARKVHAASKTHAHAHAHKKSHAAAHAKNQARDPTMNADEDDSDDGSEGFDDSDYPDFDESKYVDGREVFRRRRRDARRRWMRRRGMRTIYSSATAPPTNCQCAGMQVRCGSPCSRRHSYIKAPYTYVSPLSNTPAANSVSDGKNVFTRFNGVYSTSADVPSGFSPSSSTSGSPYPSQRPPWAYSDDGGDDNPYMYFGRAYTADWPAAARFYHTPWEWRQRMLEQLGPKPRISDSLRAVDRFNHKYVRRQRIHDIWANLKKHENDHYDWEEAELDAASLNTNTNTNTACNSGDTCRQSYLDGNTNSCQQNSECYRPGDENYR